ncbi:MAG: alpha/beta hydrolase, partial [Pseudonocardia sediminis]
LGWFYDTLAASPGAIDDETRRSYVEAYRGEERMRAGFEYYRSREADVANARRVGAGGISVPVLALGGAESWGRGAEPLECLRFFASDVTGDVIADCGHFVPEERPEELAAHLRPFLRRCLPS